MVGGLALLVFLYLPIAVLVLQSFNASRFGGRWQGFSLEWYARLFQHREVMQALLFSLQLALLTAVGAMVLGTLSALALHQQRGRWRALHLALVTLPTLMPDVLMGLGLLLWLVSLNLPLGLGTLWVAHVTFSLGFVVLCVLGRLQQLDQALGDAARDLGAQGLQLWRRVLLPLLWPGIAAGGLVAFTLSLDDVAVSFFVKGAGESTLPLRVYGMLKMSRELPIINALCSLLWLFSALMLWLASRLWRRKMAH
jgi:spermidine/putrescine transport system permease protein